MPALVSASGIHGLQTSGLPEPVLSYLLRDRVVPVNLELEAYRNGRTELLVELICLDPWTKTVRQAREFVDAILNMNFNAGMKAHYR